MPGDGDEMGWAAGVGCDAVGGDARSRTDFWLGPLGSVSSDAKCAAVMAERTNAGLARLSYS